ESLSATGFIRNPLLLRTVGRMVKAIYTQAEAVLVQSMAFHKQVAHYAKPEKIMYFPNPHRAVALEASTVSKVSPELLATIEQSFSVVVTGNIGTAQAVETWVEAAERLRHVPDLKLVVVGSGSMLDWLAEQIAIRKLDNIILTGRY